MKHPEKSRGFTLLELAIVLVIISLLAASVTIGYQLVKQGYKRSAIGEIDRYTKAIDMFTDKFHALPGDFDEAESYWGADTNCPNTSFNTVPKKATCNGDGNGVIDNTDNVTVFGSYERFRAWQHLADAGMLEGQFSGVAGNVSSEQILVASVPKSDMGGGYTLLYFNYPVGDAQLFAMTGRHLLDFGRVAPECAVSANTAYCSTHSPLMTPADAAEIDQKIDDGRPGLGKVMGRPPANVDNPGCTTTADPLTSKYDVDTDKILCALTIDTGH